MSEKKKKGFKMPHLLWIMFGLILVMCALTYVVPAGSFARDEAGKVLDPIVFNYLGAQSPVDPWMAVMSILEGLTGSATIVFAVMTSGATIAIILESKVFDRLLNYAVYKLKDKGQNTIIIIMFILMVYLGAFGGSDALIAIVPIGVLFAKKLKLDNITAVAITTFATLLGFGTGPTKQVNNELLMGATPYGNFFFRFVVMNIFMLIGMFFVVTYCAKIKKDPSKSPMYKQGWDPDEESGEVDDSSIVEATFGLRDILLLTVFLGQYPIIVWYSINYSATFYPFMIGFGILIGLICGVIAGMDADRLGNTFAKGISSMAFVGFVIGLARVVSLVMSKGQILETIIYFLTQPLQGLPSSVSYVGMTAIISVINVVIPSASSKGALLIPIMQPIIDTLKLNRNVGVMAFQYGDGFTNIVSPLLGWTVGSCVTANLPFDKWFRWALPKVLIMIGGAFVVMFIASFVCS